MRRFFWMLVGTIFIIILIFFGVYVDIYQDKRTLIAKRTEINEIIDSIRYQFSLDKKDKVLVNEVASIYTSIDLRPRFGEDAGKIMEALNPIQEKVFIKNINWSVYPVTNQNINSWKVQIHLKGSYNEEIFNGLDSEFYSFMRKTLSKKIKIDAMDFSNKMYEPKIIYLNKNNSNNFKDFEMDLYYIKNIYGSIK